MTSTFFRDFTLLMVLGFVAMVVWMLPHLNPPSQDRLDDPPGNVVVSISWPEGDSDVDLWLLGPGEPRPVGYTNKSGQLWNLLRDDLGNQNDLTGANFENAYTRGVAAGEYIVNVHCYRCRNFPVEVQVEVRIKSGEAGGKAGSMRTLAVTTVTLAAPWEELTALRFELTADGALVPDSMNHLYEPLRSSRVGP